MSNLPIQFEDKVNSPELLAYLQQFGEKSYLSAEEINQIRDAINELAQGSILDDVLKNGSVSLSGLSLSIAAKAFAWRINQQLFLTPAAYSVNLTAAANGFYRTDILVGTSTGTYQIIQGNQSATDATEPNVPSGMIRLAGFFIFGSVVTTDAETGRSYFKPEIFKYTSGPQVFTPQNGISQVLTLFVNGQMWDEGEQFTYDSTSITIKDALPTTKLPCIVSVIYSEAPVPNSPFITTAQANDLFLLKSDYNEVERFLEYKKASSITPSLMIDYVGDKGFADSGVRIDRDYVLEEMSITFARFVNAAALLVPIQIRVHEPNASTQSTPVTGTLIKELECFSDPSNVFNKVFDYVFPDEDWSAYTGKFITVNTANFALGGSTLEDVLVTIKLRKK